MALLSLLAIASVVGALWAMEREYTERCKLRQRQKVWAERALAVKQSHPERLAERARMAAFTIRPLSDADRARFEAEWRRTRVRFVDDPMRAIADADRLVDSLMYTRGVPAWTLELDQATSLAWCHPELEEHYRTAHKIANVNARGVASTAELHQALRSYKVLYRRLLDTD